MRVAACIETLFWWWLPGHYMYYFRDAKASHTERTFLTYLKSFHITELRRKAPLRIDGISLQNAFKGCVLGNKCKN